MKKMMLVPWHNVESFDGKVGYSETAHAWNNIRLHKGIIRHYPALMARSAKISFRIDFMRSMEDLKQRVAELEKEKQGVPLLLYLYLDEPLT